MGCILLNQHSVYAKDAANEGTEVAKYIYSLGPPMLLTAVEIYKIRAYIKIYIKNLKLYLHEPPIST